MIAKRVKSIKTGPPSKVIVHCGVPITNLGRTTVNLNKLKYVPKIVRSIKAEETKMPNLVDLLIARLGVGAAGANDLRS